MAEKILGKFILAGDQVFFSNHDLIRTYAIKYRQAKYQPI